MKLQKIYVQINKYVKDGEDKEFPILYLVFIDDEGYKVRTPLVVGDRSQYKNFNDLLLSNPDLEIVF